MALSAIRTELAGFDWHNLKNIETVGSWPLTVRVMVLSILFLLCVVPACQFAVFRLGAQLTIQVDEGDALHRELEQQMLAAAALPAQSANTLSNEQTLGAFHRQLPEEGQVPELLDSITAVGRDNRLELMNVSLEPEQIQAFYIEQPIRMQARGNYHDFASFISGLAALPRLVTLHDFSMERVTGGRLTIDFMLRVYRRDDNAGGVSFSGRGESALSPGIPHEPASYAGAALRSPFDEIGVELAAESQDPGLAPIDRPAEVLESFPLSALSLVGTIAHGSVIQALVRDSRGRVHRMAVGHYMGQDHGRVQRITATRIDLMEIVQAGEGWVQRPRALLLQEACGPACALADETGNR